MSIQDQQAVTRSFDSEHHQISRSLTEVTLRRMLRGLECGQLVVDTPGGERIVFDGDRPGPKARLTVHSWPLPLATRYGLGSRLCRGIHGGRVVFAQPCYPAEVRLP